MARTTTTRLALSKPTPGTAEPYDASIDAGTNWDKIDAAVSFTECTSSTRPTGADAWDGRGIIESDTGKAYVLEDGAWRQVVVNTGTSVPIDDDVSITGTLSVSSTFSNGNAIPNVQRFTADGTWTKPTGAKSVWVRCWGGGGAGGGAAATGASSSSCGSGGQAGGYAESIFAASALSSTEAVDIGTGGTGGTGAGGTGADTTFAAGAGNEVRAAGGNGGTILAASTAMGATAGATVTQTNTGNVNTSRGGMGGYGLRNFGGTSSGVGVGGQGGIAAGMGGNGTNGANGGGGSAGANTGGGGGGAGLNASQAAANGGGGGTGLCIVVSYFD